MTASAVHDVAVAYMMLKPPTRRGEQESLEITKGLAGYRVALETREPH